MENIFSRENPNKCKSKKTYKRLLLSEVFNTINIRNFDHQNWSDFFGVRTYFSLPGSTGSYIFGYLNAKFQPVDS